MIEKMKAKSMLVVSSLFLLATITVFMACSKDSYGPDYDGPYSYEMASGEGAYDYLGGKSGNGGNGNGDNTPAGIVTAGEWSDLMHWQFWSGLMQSEDFADKSDYWQFYTNNRVAVKVIDNKGNAVAGVSVKLLRSSDAGKSPLWEAVTDNHGLAECWVGLFQKETAPSSDLSVSIDDKLMDGHPKLCPWDSLGQAPVNQYVYTKKPATIPTADIAFVVDATGSMGDEIEFLKNDLEYIINKVESDQPVVTMRTAAVFYRDEGDEYVTRHSNFSENLSVTREFIAKQRADGGNDYPEAVHTAFECMLQNLSWNAHARTRLAFLILDAPAHHEESIIHSLQQSVTLCARQGIRLIPVAASGVDKNAEFMLRFFAVATGGTYVFLTNDSGVGNDHIAATVGDYEVEQLNNLIVRLINYYTE